MKKPNKKVVITASAICVVLIAVIAALILFLGRDKTTLIKGKYSEQSLPDYTVFIPANAIKQMFDGQGGYAFYDNADIYFENGEYKTSDIPKCVSENGVLYITTDEYGRKTPQEFAEAIGSEYVIYDNRLAVFSYKKDFVDVFSDIYTLEAFTLYLKGAGEADIVNAFITLPNFITNGTTNSVYYTEPNLHLGIQTEIYSAAMDGFATEYESVPKAPVIAAGQGNSKTNNTLVRVFNEEQACTAQFLAFAPEVKGGVQVRLGASDSGKLLIAAAAYDASLKSAQSIKVFDSFGTLIYSFVPKNIKAPYNIEIGKFISDSDKYYLFVSPMTADGKNSTFELYDLTDGSFKKTVKGGFDSGVKKQKITLSSFSPDADRTKTEKIIVTFTDSNKVYYLDCNDSSWTNADITLSENITGIYSSAFKGEILGSVSEEVYSNICVYGSGVSENASEEIKKGVLLNVGDKENHFYSTYAESNPDGYVDFGAFNHLRTDLSNAAMDEVSRYTDKIEEIPDYLKSLPYESWKYIFSQNQKELYHSQYNMWEPCFTHRWNSTQFTQNLTKVIKDGYPAYASIGRNNASGTYEELESSFLIGTYADGVIELAKLRIYPLRTALQQIAAEFRGVQGEPEKLIAVSPVHEQEINIAGSVGDYHPNMITGFRKYLLDLYGSVQNINKRFGTEFNSEEEIDAPRFDPKSLNNSECRGDWDIYGKSDYFTQWSLYTRYIVNKRILEAYREALLAGFPPEAINAHQIPEGDAVAGFLGEANTRISPTDVVSICGTAYGGTRYGFFANSVNNFIELAHGAGHNNITLGEYSALADDYDIALKQLRYLYENGVKFTHIIVPYPANSLEYKYVSLAESKAIKKLQEENNARTASTGGTGMIHPVYRGDKSFNIVQLGDENHNGLLKSVKQDGTWEGSVYIVPFHSGVDVTSVKMNKTKNGYASGAVKGMQYGDQIELTFHAKYKGKDTAYVNIEVYHAGCLIEGAAVKYALTANETPYRYVLSNQLTMDEIEIRITFECEDRSQLVTEHLQCTLQTEDAAHKYVGDFEREANKGGISFDIFETDILK